QGCYLENHRVVRLISHHRTRSLRIAAPIWTPLTATYIHWFKLSLLGSVCISLPQSHLDFASVYIYTIAGPSFSCCICICTAPLICICTSIVMASAKDDSLQAIGVKLNGNNYVYWAYVMKNFLIGKGLWGYLSRSRAFSKIVICMNMPGG
ncbi:hypothetical protein DVH24_034424, partial [Malus domestica]